MSEVAVLSGVGLVREGSWILSDVDWTIRTGERWVLLGPNGSGKTSLLQILSTYLYPSAGTVTVFGKRHGQTDVRILRRRIGYAGPALARLLRDDLTAIDAVVTAKSAALGPWWDTYTERDVGRARRLLDGMGCGALLDRRIGTLSDGERQRVQIARALMCEPALLLLDEPGAGLDLGARERLIPLLADLAGDGRTPAIVLVTHHVEEIPPAFTHALLLRGGTVHARGPIRETLDAETLSGCFGLPLHVVERDGRYAAWGAGGAEPDAGVMSAGRAAAGGSRHRLTIVDTDGRAKIYRPLPASQRLAALGAGLAAYAAGRFFEAHELLEPAWMGTDDQIERDLYQGLIKLAAAGVHAQRGNPVGVRKNLVGARRRLASVTAVPASPAPGTPPRPGLVAALERVDPAAVIEWVDRALARLDAAGSEPRMPLDAEAAPGPEDFRAAPVTSGVEPGAGTRTAARRSGPGPAR